MMIFQLSGNNTSSAKDCSKRSTESRKISSHTSDRTLPAVFGINSLIDQTLNVIETAARSMQQRLLVPALPPNECVVRFQSASWYHTDRRSLLFLPSPHGIPSSYHRFAKLVIDEPDEHRQEAGTRSDTRNISSG